MVYIGNSSAANFSSVTKDTFNGGDTSGASSVSEYTLSKPATTNGVAVYVENVRQIPTTAYTVSGTTLTFTGTTPSGTNNVYVLHHNSPVSTATHPAAQDLTAANATLTGDVTVTGATALNGTVTGTAMVHLNTTTVTHGSATANVIFNNTLITTTYSDYIVRIHSFEPVTDNVQLWVYVSVDNGSNFISSITKGQLFRKINNNSANNGLEAGSAAYLTLGGGIGNDDTEGSSYIVDFIGLTQATNKKYITFNHIGKEPTDAYMWNGGAIIPTTSAVNYLKFQLSSGNMNQGTFSLYGMNR
jgi:hypothetical protein